MFFTFIQNNVVVDVKVKLGDGFPSSLKEAVAIVSMGITVIAIK